MQSPFVTNILLVVIAALLLVQVIQAGGQRRSSASVGTSYPNHHSSPQGVRNPSVQSDAALMGHHMIYQAMSGFPEGCEGVEILSDCQSPAAMAVKSEIEGLVKSGMGPRQVFDFVVEKYGLQALTPQAQDIRRMRTGQP